MVSGDCLKALQQREKFMRKFKRAALWERLHERNAKRVLSSIIELEGLWVKLGQYLSTRADVTGSLGSMDQESFLSRQQTQETDQKAIGMEVLQNQLKLQHADLIFAAVKDPSNIHLLVICSNGLEKIYSCFSN
ncbi:hypothetical protein RHMOL_Rhmol01G0053500 [Rhododendron molle]|uniref:Uncharacterized protein n=1 Tax=Rhododendron molle TaxID=49168 RepID=A0ACC0PY52_RHOML|nr:hypothetical protein RHMOL_Rhmol01G0053500 [Rhododendron molle]